MFGKKVIVLAVSILAISLWGCSADFEAENNQTSGGAGTAVVDNSSVGAANCIGCHEVLDIANSTTVVADYLAGKHVIHSTHVDAADDCALKCHDPFGDGRGLESYIKVGGPYDPTTLVPPPVVDREPVDEEADYLTANGLAAVTCETCHGAGGDHVNGADIPYKTPDYNRCGQCHNSDFFHNGYHPEADNIVEDYTSSKHFSGAIRNSIACVKCHTDAGARLYKDIDALSVLTLADALPVAESNSIQCRTCHDPHNNGKLLKPATASGSAEYNTCTNCHQRHDATINVGNPILQITGTSTLDGSNGDLIFHAGSWDRVISSTHWDDPATNVIDSADQFANKIEGYAIDPLNERACRDCHNVHGADATINKQWASSAHGSKIREAKEAAAVLPYPSTLDQVAAVRAAGANGADNALPHYDWDSTYKADGSDPDTLPDLDRGSCQMCHTATGARNFLTDPPNYDPANNDFSHLTGWAPHTPTTPTVSSGQNELIYCWACHSNNSGALRNPGAITLAYTVDTVNPTLPDLGKSNVCVNCHGGRGNMDSYALTGTPSTDMSTLIPGFGPGTKNVTASHYFTAAAMIFQSQTRLGYEYYATALEKYKDKPYYAHKRIDLNNASPETGSGPCASCHMTGKNHSLDVVEKDGSGVITALKGTICITCHDGEHALFAAQDLVGTTQNIWNGSAAVPTVVTQQMATDSALELEHEAEGFHEALAILEQQLIANGLTYTGNYPYFSGGPWGDEGTFGAGHNYVVLHHEPGAFAHNRYYAKRLIFDSIDWLDGDNWDTTVDPAVPGTDGNNLDGKITIVAATYPKADAWLSSGTKRP